jgi:hypothetical protein
MAYQKANKRTFCRIVDGQRHNTDARSLKATDNLQQLANTILQEHCELTYRRVISTTHGLK